MNADKKSYTIISGTGRAGTTLLMRILGAAGVNIGFDMAALPIDPISRAGLELDLRDKPDCTVVKSPHIASYIGDVLETGDIAIDHAIICMRPLLDAAESRRRVQKLNATDAAEVTGGLTYTSEPDRQEDVLGRLFFNLVFHLSKHEVPMTFLHYPRFAVDSAYFLAKIAPLFDIGTDAIEKAFYAEVNPEVINAEPELAALSDNALLRGIAFCETDGSDIFGRKLEAEMLRRLRPRCQA